MATGTDIRYSVHFTPLTKLQTYGTEIDVSDRVVISGVSSIKKSIDDTDYGIGVYTFGDIVIKASNYDGKFNEMDSRSIFTTTRDLTKVRVVFTDEDGDTLTFKGLINDEATRFDVVKHIVSFKVLALDSVIRNSKVPAGTVSAGTTIKAALNSILSQARITSVLTVTESNINPDLNVVIDVGTPFDNQPVKAAVNELLLVSNSAFFINSSDEVIVKSRAEDTTKDVVNLYGKSDIFGRENIIKLSKYNTGQHRMFTSIKVNDTEKSNTGFEIDFGTRQKEISIDWVTTESKEVSIAERLVEEFKTPKIELEVTLSTKIGKDIDLLDRVSVNYPLRLEPSSGNTFLPTYGVSKYGESDVTYPNVFGGVSIDSNVAFKVIGIKHNPRKFETTLKLRQSGTETNDGVYSVEGSQLYGSGTYGTSLYV